MFEQYVQQLRSSDPEQRRAAIIGLGRLGDARALPYLAQLYKAETDATLRDLAAKAGRHLQKLKAGNTGAPEPMAEPAVPPVSSPIESPKATTPASNIPSILADYMAPPPSDGRVFYDGTYETIVTGDDDPTEDPPSNLPSILAAYTKPQSTPSMSYTPAGSSGSSAGSGGSSGSILSDEDFQLLDKPGKAVILAKPVSPQAVQKAKNHLNAAFSYKTKGDDTNALAQLAKAVKTNPDLAQNASALGLAASLVGGQGKEAMAIVLQKSEDKSVTKHKGAAFDAEIIDVVLALAFLFVVIVIFSLAFFYGSLAVSTALLSVGPNRASASDLRMLFNTFSLRVILPDILRLTAVTIGSTLFQTIVIYVMGIMMGGAGAFLRFARTQTVIQILLYIMLAAALGVAIMGVFSGSTNTFQTAAQVAGILLLGATVGGLGLQAFFAARVQEFGFFKGLASVLVGSAAAGFIAGLLGLFNINNP